MGVAKEAGSDSGGAGSVSGDAARRAGCGWGCGGALEVAMTRKVVRSKRTTSVALQASASLVRWRVRTDALGIRVWTIRDHAYVGPVRRVRAAGYD